MNFYIINKDAVLNGDKVDPDRKLFWVQDANDQKELSTALINLEKIETARKIEPEYVYSFSNHMVSLLREKGNLSETKGTKKPANIESAQGLKVYDEKEKKMYTYDAVPLAIFNIMNNNTTIVGKAMQKEKPPKPQSQKPSEPQSQKSSASKKEPNKPAKSSQGGIWSWFSGCYATSDETSGD